MIVEDDQDALAAEYVLGTLDTDERRQAQALLGMNPGFAAMVQGWERRFGELHQLVEAVEPPPAVFQRIKERMAGTEPSADMRLPEVKLSGAPAAASEKLRRRLCRWRALALVASALAIALAAFIVASVYVPDRLPPALRLPR